MILCSRVRQLRTNLKSGLLRSNQYQKVCIWEVTVWYTARWKAHHGGV